MRAVPFNAPLALSLAAIALAAAVCGAQAPGLLEAILPPRLDQERTASRLQSFLEDHQADLDRYVARFDGRSLFFRPKAPPPPVRIAEPREEKPNVEPPRQAGPPPSYLGPSVLFVLGDEIWFHGGLRLRVGEEGQGVRVIASDPPWSVRLGHSGGEYDIELFKRASPGLAQNSQVSRATPGLRVVEARERLAEAPAQEDQPQ